MIHVLALAFCSTFQTFLGNKDDEVEYLAVKQVNIKCLNARLIKRLKTEFMFNLAKMSRMDKTILHQRHKIHFMRLKMVRFVHLK